MMLKYQYPVIHLLSLFHLVEVSGKNTQKKFLLNDVFKIYIKIIIILWNNINSINLKYLSYPKQYKFTPINILNLYY